MSALQLAWSKLFLSTTSLTPEEEDESRLQVVQWQMSGSTLQLTRFVDEPSVIDIRLDQDVEGIEYNLPDSANTSAVVVLKMLPSRPFPWAANTTLDADDPQNNEILFEVTLEDDEDRDRYKMLTQWLISHQNAGCSHANLEGEGDDRLDELLAGMNLQDEALAATKAPEDRRVRFAHGTLTREDIKRLDHKAWANDEIIDFGMKWAKHCAREENPDMNCYIFATQFYSVLLKNRFHNWFKRRAMHEYDFCVFPTNINNLHWVLVIVDQARYATLEGRQNGRSAAIYVLDSLKSTSTLTVATNFQNFVQQYYKTDDYIPDVSCFTPAVPQQRNSWDCGYWTIHFCRMFLSKPAYFRDLIRETNPYNFDICWNRKGGLKTRRTLRELVEAKDE